MTAYMLCVALAVVYGWIHHQLHTTNLPGPTDGAPAVEADLSNRRPRAGGPDLGAILVTRPALYHTLTSLYVYHPAPMSQWLADEEVKQAKYCHDVGIQWRGLAQP